tara:strand:- start:311 stop:445 length:135 start_codon:yes stop_codon:yes gene_type:complete
VDYNTSLKMEKVSSDRSKKNIKRTKKYLRKRKREKRLKGNFKGL